MKETCARCGREFECNGELYPNCRDKLDHICWCRNCAKETFGDALEAMNCFKPEEEFRVKVRFD